MTVCYFVCPGIQFDNLILSNFFLNKIKFNKEYEMETTSTDRWC